MFSMFKKSVHTGGEARGKSVAKQEKEARKKINSGRTPVANLPPAQAAPRNGRTNLIGVVLPSLCGKTTAAERFGWLDCDDLVTEIRRDEIFSEFSQNYIREGWNGAMNQFALDCSASLNVLNFSTPTIIFGHSVSVMATMGVVPRLRLVPTRQMQAELLAKENGGSAAFARANFRAAEDEGDSSKMLKFASWGELSSILCSLAKNVGMDTDLVATSQDAAISDYNNGRIGRDDADRLVRELGKIHRGFGRGKGSWARAAAPLSHGDYDIPPIDGDIDGELMERALNVDRDLALAIAQKPNLSSVHAQAVLTLLVTLEGNEDFIDVIGSLLTVPEPVWEQVMRKVCAIVKTSSSYLGYDLDDEERRIMSELWLLAHRSTKSLNTLVRERLCGAGSTFKRLPVLADLQKACEKAQLTSGERTIKQAMAAELSEWITTWKVADKSMASDVLDSLSAFSIEGGTTWYKVCRSAFFTIKSQILPKWLVMLMKVKERDVGSVLWVERLESEFMKLMSYLLSAAVAEVDVMVFSVPLASEDDDKVVAASLTLGLKTPDRHHRSEKRWAVDAICETITYLESKVVAAIETSLAANYDGKAHEIWANLWQRGKTYNMTGLQWVARRKFDIHKRRSDNYIAIYIARMCSPRKYGGDGRVSITGHTFKPDGHWVKGERQGGSWVKTTDTVHLLRLGGPKHIRYTDVSCANALETKHVMTLGVIGSCITSEIKSEELCRTVGRLLSKKAIVLTGAQESQVDIPEAWESTEDIDKLIEKLVTV
nr:Rep [Gnomoniopsis castaneae chrysovirus 1]